MSSSSCNTMTASTSSLSNLSSSNTQSSSLTTSSSSSSNASASVYGSRRRYDDAGATKSLSGFWEADEAALTCRHCHHRFHLFRRRHHCRLCGCVFCGNCCFQRKLAEEGEDDDRHRLVKTCLNCFENKRPARVCVGLLLSHIPGARNGSRFQRQTESEARRLMRSSLLPPFLHSSGHDRSHGNRPRWTRSMFHGAIPCPIDSLANISRMAYLQYADHLLHPSVIDLMDAAHDHDNSPSSDRAPYSNVAIGEVRQSLNRQRIRLTEYAAMRLQEVVGHDLAVSCQDFLVSISRQAAFALKEVDLSSHLTIIAVAGGSPVSSFFIRGVVLRKNVVHRRMRSRILSPSIALIDMPLTLHDTSLLTLGRIKYQERARIKRLCYRLLKIQPDVIISSTVIPRSAQDLFRSHHITVAVQIDHDTLRQLSRSTGATIIGANLIDQITQDHLGHCGKFHIETITDRDDVDDDEGKNAESGPFMIFDDCPGEQAITVVLRGADMSYLQRVVPVLQDLASLAHIDIINASFLNNVFGQYIHSPSDDEYVRNRPEWICLRRHRRKPTSTSEVCSRRITPSHMTLRSFMDEICFNPDPIKCCSSCNPQGSAFDHLHLFGAGQVQVLIEIDQLPSKLVLSPPSSSPSPSPTVIWNRCLICRGKVTPVSILTSTAQSINLTRYLSLWLSQNRSPSYSRFCRHLLFQDHITYIARDDIIVTISTKPSIAYRVVWPYSPPPPSITSQPHYRHQPGHYHNNTYITNQSLTQLTSSITSFLMESVRRLDLSHTSRDAIRDDILDRSSSLLRSISEYNGEHRLDMLSSESVWARLILVNTIYRWATCAQYHGAVQYGGPGRHSATTTRSGHGQHRPTIVRYNTYLVLGVGDGDRPSERARSRSERRPGRVRSWSVDSGVDNRWGSSGPGSREDHHPDHVQGVSDLMQCSMDLRPTIGDLIVPIRYDDPSSYIAHVLSTISYLHYIHPGRYPTLPAHLPQALSVPPSPDRPDHQHFNFKIVSRSISATIQCSALFARQFHTIRTRFFTAGDRQYIASMISSELWNDHGGKSGARFRMTHDHRLIIKSLTEREYRMLMANADPYFDYLEQCDGATCLVPILGLYRVEKESDGASTGALFHRPHRTTQLFMVVPNVFSDVNTSAEFDLKGRGGAADDRSPDLEQMNLFAFSKGIPIALGHGDYEDLISRLIQDTKFLANGQSPGAMDYSVLVGIDERSRRIAFGVIDYITHYTFDRKVENRLKTAQASLFGFQSPTIANPIDYRHRLLSAIKRYFYSVLLEPNNSLT